MISPHTRRARKFKKFIHPTKQVFMTLKRHRGDVVQSSVRPSVPCVSRVTVSRLPAVSLKPGTVHHGYWGNIQCKESEFSFEIHVIKQALPRRFLSPVFGPSEVRHYVAFSLRDRYRLYVAEHTFDSIQSTSLVGTCHGTHGALLLSQ